MALEGEVFWENERTSWCCSNYTDYVLLQAGANVADLEKKLSSIPGTYMIPEALQKTPEKGEIEWLKSMSFELQPIDEIYLNAEEVNDSSYDVAHGDIRFIWLFGSIAVFILILACFNFINLSTARSASRAKEVGIRKVVGSMRAALIRQFLTESFLFSFIAIVIAVVATSLLLPSFNNIANRSISLPLNELWFIPTLFVVSLFVGVVSGIYPAFHLSSFQPGKVLKIKNKTGLVVFLSSFSSRSPRH
ncbi:MAG: FtsX-like permease family protein [Bacteroidota bacterium]